MNHTEAMIDHIRRVFDDYQSYRRTANEIAKVIKKDTKGLSGHSIHYRRLYGRSTWDNWNHKYNTFLQFSPKGKVVQKRPSIIEMPFNGVIFKYYFVRGILLVDFSKIAPESNRRVTNLTAPHGFDLRGGDLP